MTERTCSLPDCLRRHVARGLCKNHYYAAGHGFTDRECRISGCERRTTPKTGDGLCDMHYARRRRTGKTDDGRYYKPWLTPAEVLWERAEPFGECILWTGRINDTLYGVINGQVWQGYHSPHRFSWALINGPIPEGMEVDHVCHNRDALCVPSTCHHRRCINPDHLELVTREENMRRKVARTAAV